MAKLSAAFQVEIVKGVFTRTISIIEQDKKPVGHTGDKFVIVNKIRQEEQEFYDGFMLYFPQGHSMMVAADDYDQIERLGINRPIPVVDLESGEEAPDGFTLTPKETVMKAERNRPRATGGLAELGLEV